MPKRAPAEKPVEQHKDADLPVEVMPGVAAISNAAVSRALDDMADLFRNAENLPRAAFPVVIRDAQARVVALRKLLGL